MRRYRMLKWKKTVPLLLYPPNMKEKRPLMIIKKVSKFWFYNVPDHSNRFNHLSVIIITYLLDLWFPTIILIMLCPRLYVNVVSFIWIYDNALNSSSYYKCIVLVCVSKLSWIHLNSYLNSNWKYCEKFAQFICTLKKYFKRIISIPSACINIYLCWYRHLWTSPKPHKRNTYNTIIWLHSEPPYWLSVISQYWYIVTANLADKCKVHADQLLYRPVTSCAQHNEDITVSCHKLRMKYYFAISEWLITIII